MYSSQIVKLDNTQSNIKAHFSNCYNHDWFRMKAVIYYRPLFWDGVVLVFFHQFQIGIILIYY